jgi:hypothetical protein
VIVTNRWVFNTLIRQPTYTLYSVAQGDIMCPPEPGGNLAYGWWKDAPA